MRGKELLFRRRCPWKVTSTDSTTTPRVIIYDTGPARLIKRFVRGRHNTGLQAPKRNTTAANTLPVIAERKTLSQVEALEKQEQSHPQPPPRDPPCGGGAAPGIPLYLFDARAS